MQDAYSCLWCKVDFTKKIDLLQHFMNLHQDMLMVPGEAEASQGHQIPEGKEQTKGQGQSEDALDLRVKQDNDAVRVEVVPYSEIIDMSCTRKRKKPKTVKEALIHKKKGNVDDEGHNHGDGTDKTVTGDNEHETKKRKRAKSKKHKATEQKTETEEGQQGALSGQMTPSESDPQRPKYSLTSLIEALRESIERDKSKTGGEEGEQAEDDKSVCYDDLSSSEEGEDDDEDIGFMETGAGRPSDSEDSNVQVSVKTFQVDGKMMYKCSVCSKVFSKTCTFARHAMVHSKMYPYQCGLCDEKCSDMRVLLRHLDWHGENVDCPCKKCERLHRSSTEKKDNKDGAPTSKFFCEICGREFQSDVACKAHVNMHKRGENLMCEICRVTFQCNRVLSKHRKSAHGVQFCPYCLESCHLDMASHMSTHSGVFMYRCGLCGDGYNSRPLLHEHLKIHTHLGKEFSQEQKETFLEAKKPVLPPKVNKDKTKSSGAIKTVGNKGKKKVSNSKGGKGRQLPVKKKVKDTESSREAGATEDGGNATQGKKNPPRTMKRKCRWHDNDSVCERCDTSFVKKIAFGRKPKSRQGKESPRQSDSGSYPESLSLDVEAIKSKLVDSESPIKVLISDHDYGTEVTEITTST